MVRIEFVASSKAVPKDLDDNAWIDAGLAAILEGGLRAVAVEPLARVLGVTKGSFYWHFRDRNALLEAMVDRWAMTTDSLIARVNETSKPLERLEALIEAVHGSPGLRTMRTMGALAADPTVGPRVRAVAAAQQAFLARCFTDAGVDARRARAAAKVVYSATIGVGELEALGVGFASAAERKAYIAELLAFVHGVR